MEAVTYLLLLLICAIFFGKIAERFKQPTIVGNIIGGLFAGPGLIFIFEQLDKIWYDGTFIKITHHLQPEIVENEIFFIMELAVIMLMFASGLETRIKDFIASFKTGIITAALGVVVPFTFGFVGAYLYIGDMLTAFYVGAALSITAVALSIATLIQMDGVRTRFGMTIINAAIVDDIIGILILSVLLSFSSSGKLSALDIAGTVALSIVFVVASLFIIPLLLKKMYNSLRELRTTERVGIGILMAGLFGVIAHIMGLHLMIGAFLGGMAIRDSLNKRTKESLGKWSFGFFAPIFFAWVGFSVSFTGLALSPLVPLIIVLGFSGKVIGAGLGAKISGLNWAESLLVGVGMNGKAAVELILASVALEAGIIERDLYSAVVIMAATMALFTPMILKFLYKKFKEKGYVEG